MGRPTLSNYENLEPEIFSCIDIRPGECYDVTDLLNYEKVKFRSSESKETVLEVDCADDVVDDAEGSAFDNKEQLPKPLRKGNLRQRKETAQIDQKRGDFCHILPWSEKELKVLLVLLFFSQFIAGGYGAPIHHEDFNKMIMKKLGEQVIVTLRCPDKCHLDFSNSTDVKGHYEPVCEIFEERYCTGDYKIDEVDNLFFTANDKTAGGYLLIDFDTNKIECSFQLVLLSAEPVKSGASSNMPSELLMALGFVMFVFFIRSF